MTPADIQAFRAGFCKRAAELGYLPSELLAVKQALDPTAVPAAAAKAAVGLPGAAAESAQKGLSTLGLLAGLGLLGGGLVGGLGSYFYNKSKFELDPEDNILPDYTPVEEAKNIHLLAKYRNAKRMINSGVA